MSDRPSGLGTIRTLICEDESLAVRALREYLKDVEWVEVVGDARDGRAAMRLIHKLEPDLVFMDVRMPRLTGMEVLEAVTHRPAVVFTTAHDEHAVKAFELGAVDYLVKPFGRERFAEALDRVRERLDADSARGREPSASRRARTALADEDGLERLFVRSAGSIVPVDLDDVRRMEASGDYVRVHVEDESYLVSLSLTELERRLDPDCFLRIHRSHLVNADHIDRVEKHDRRRLRVHLDDGTAVVASRSGSRDLRDRTV